MADWITELRPSRMAFVEPLRHQLRMPSRSLRSVKAQHRPLPLGVSIAGKVLLGSCVGSHRTGNGRIRPFAGSLLIWNIFTE